MRFLHVILLGPVFFSNLQYMHKGIDKKRIIVAIYLNKVH